MRVAHCCNRQRFYLRLASTRLRVGGRFSVLTPVGLLPIAVAGFDIDKLVAGAVEMEKACGADVPFEQNPAALYAATRNE